MREYLGLGQRMPVKGRAPGAAPRAAAGRFLLPAEQSEFTLQVLIGFYLLADFNLCFCVCSKSLRSWELTRGPCPLIRALLAVRALPLLLPLRWLRLYAISPSSYIHIYVRVLLWRCLYNRRVTVPPRVC